MNKYLFLDIDGVLNSERTVAAYRRLTYAGKVKQDIECGNSPQPMWDPIAVNLLRAAQQEIGFGIIISSTWRKALSLEDFHKVFDLYGWDTRGIIVGKTGDETGTRGQQIKAWLDAHGKFPYNYCIIDDDSDMLESQQEFFVKTNFRNGLKFEAFVQIFEVFGVTYREVGVLDFSNANT